MLKPELPCYAVGSIIGPGCPPAVRCPWCDATYGEDRMGLPMTSIENSDVAWDLHRGLWINRNALES